MRRLSKLNFTYHGAGVDGDDLFPPHIPRPHLPQRWGRRGRPLSNSFTPNLSTPAQIYVTERNSNFGIEDCFTLNCNLKYCCISHEIKRTSRIKNRLYFDVELIFKLMKIVSKIYFFNSLFYSLGGGGNSKIYLAAAVALPG